MLKPICFPCNRFFRLQKSGFCFTEGMPISITTRRPQPGNAEPESWGPYKVWSGDLWACQGCGATIISGVGRSPITEKHHKDFEETRKRNGADQYQVNDC